MPRARFAQLYEDERDIVPSLDKFVSEGLANGAGAIVVATREHLDELDARWAARGFDIAAALAKEQYVPLEAEATLAHLLRDGWPDPRLFRGLIEPILERAVRRFPRIVAFGEMVGLLWQREQFSAAVRLEQLWSEVAAHRPVTLFCAYRLETASDPGEQETLPEPGESGLFSHTDGLQGASSETLPGQDLVRRLEREISKRKLIERTLARRERDMRDFLQNAPVPMHSVGPDGIVSWANAAELALLGLTPEECIGQPLTRFHADPEAANRLLERLMRGEDLRGEPAVLRAKDGTLKHVLIDSNGLWENEKFVHSRCLTRDVTQIYESAQVGRLLAAIVESSDDAIVSKTLEGRISSWNSGAEQLFGYSAEEAVGKPVTMIIPPDLQHEEKMILAKLVRGERIKSFQTKRLRKDGRLIDVSLTVSPVRDASGKIIGASKVARDITDRLRVEDQLRRVGQRKDEFLAMLGHELRNPLAPISNTAEMLRLSTLGDASKQEMCGVLARQVQHMTRLLDDLLDVSRISQGKIQFRSELVDVFGVIARACEVVRPIMDANRHALSVQLPAAPLRVKGDLIRLVQAVSNLLNNAAKYTPPGGKILISADVDSGNVVIRVRDNGMGIPADVLPTVFELFMQADRTLGRANGGLGIGLTLVRKIVEQHHGRIEATSAGPDQGSEFTIRLPALVGPLGEHAIPSSLVPASLRDEPSKRVLVVDDNHDSGDSMAMLLRKIGHQVTVALDGPSALSAASDFDPEFVLLDIGLPGMDGYEVAKRLRALGCRATLAALTGHGRADDQERSRSAGIAHHFTKPVCISTLREVIALSY
ncbi:MAG TPA: PAS domain S-box protein [Planctomycetota bacterium]|nr:PAS domain S-box protein [Planctomycetota bacterium]